MESINKKNNLPVNRFYKSREDFTIIGLTGLAGSGCSTLADYMGDAVFYRRRDIIRSPQSLEIKGVQYVNNTDLFHKAEEPVNNNAVGKLVFKRKYSICYNFIKKNYQAYTIIKYTHVEWLYVLLFVAKKYKEKLTKDNLIKDLSDILSDKFYPSRSVGLDEKYIEMYKDHIPSDFCSFLSGLTAIPWVELVNQLKKFSGSYFVGDPDPSEDKCILSDFFFCKEFSLFVKSITDALVEKDYYCLCFFYHRLAYVIRGTGDPTSSATASFTNPCYDTTHLYDLIGLVNFIIKGKRKQRKGRRDAARIVIDSIRNSMEALYLKERYTAFYLVAVHDDNRVDHLKSKIAKLFGDDKIEQERNAIRIKNLFEKVKYLTDVEVSNEDYEAGDFSGPNVGQCISDAEIHITNENELNQAIPRFNTMAEQWMKYAALIMHPGLVTPSTEERCMMIAYSAKLNSSCLARQVGAVITNKYHSIRTIGWNEVPFGQTPCGLRDARDYLKKDMINGQYYDYMYSDFERQGGHYYNDGHSFVQNLVKDCLNYKNLEENLDGLSFPYCFRSLHNKYEGNKNQVYTRSLHAEENAILQMAKFGGESLKDGIIYVTASPCELCSKKLYQIGVRQIVYIDPYPGIARQQIITAGYKRPQLKLFQGAYGATYFKLFMPFMPMKDELSIRLGLSQTKEKSDDEIISEAADEIKSRYTENQIMEICKKLK